MPRLSWITFTCVYNTFFSEWKEPLPPTNSKTRRHT
jgi:hypothetical protein